MQDLWKFIVVTVTGLVLAGTAVGIVAAQTGGDSTPSPTAEAGTPTAEAEETPTVEDGGSTAEDDKAALKDNFLDTLAGNLGISRDDLDAALRQTGLDLLDQAVADGRITEDEAATIRERIESGEGLFPFFPGHHGGFRHGFMLGAKLDDIANFLGVDLSVVTDGLRNDQSLAQIAEANGSSRDALVAFLLDNVTERVNQGVTDGRIDQARADDILSNAEQRINDLVDRQGLPDRGFPGHPFRPDADNDGSDSATGASLIF